MRRGLLLFGLGLLAGACGSDPAFFPYLTDAAATNTGGADAPDLPTPCTEHADCAGGEVCEAGACQPVDERVCEPEAAACEANVVVGCTSDGSEITRVDCGEEECVEGEVGASCIASDCEDGQIGCIDRATSYVCAEGTRELVPCADGQGCVAGECVDQVCEPSSRRCEGDTVIVCNEAGTSESTVRCDLVPECEEAAGGCTCSGGECVPLVCEPGSTVCDGQDVLRCSDDGSVQEFVATCEAPDSCIAGECRAAECEDGVSCVGDTLVVCEDGAAEEINCRDSDSFCNGAELRCEPWVCAPGSSTCTDEFTRQICNPRGTDFTESDCPDEEYCSDGICLELVCTPEERVCDGREVLVCATDGSGYELVQTCAGTELCIDGRCLGEEPECDTTFDCPAPPDRCEGTTLIEFTGRGACSRGLCDYSGVEDRIDCSASGDICDPATLRCVGGSGDIPCDIFTPCPDELFCVSDVCRECRIASDCGPDAICSAGECEACECPPGLICDAGGTCVDDDPSECDSDSDCRALAESLGVDPDTVACDPEVGCFERGICGGTMGSECPEALVCSTVLDPFSGFLGDACTGCTVGDDSTCRAGETCTEALGGLSPRYCSGGAGGGFPFP